MQEECDRMQAVKRASDDEALQLRLEPSSVTGRGVMATDCAALGVGLDFSLSMASRSIAMDPLVSRSTDEEAHSA
jgi:hypothetical protein